MSGHSLLKRLLVDKENEVGQKRLTDIYISVATTFFLAAAGYSSLTYLAAPLPALSRDHGMDNANLPVKPNSNFGATKSGMGPGENLTAASSRSLNGLNDPEAGVQLLIAIFKRVGGSQQIASINLKKNLLATNYSNPNTFGNFRSKALTVDQLAQTHSDSLSERSFSKSISAQVAPDPALSIHPQLSKNHSDDAALNQQTPGGSPNIQNYLNGATNGTLGADGFNSLGGGVPQKQSAYNHEWYKSPTQVTILDEAPVIKDRQKSVIADESNLKSRSEKKADTAEKTQDKFALDKDDRHRSRDRESEGGKDISLAANTTYGGTTNADNVAGIIRPSEQPGLFKYVREYLKEPALSAPAASAGGSVTAAAYQQASNNVIAQAPPPPQSANSPLVAAPAPERGSQSYIASLPTASRASRRIGGKGESTTYGASFGGTAAAKTMSAGNRWDYAPTTYGADHKALTKAKYVAAAPRLAFLPPNAVHGITGLPLGSSSSETVDFFKSRGKISRAEFYGIQVLTLCDNPDTPLLQAFLREGHLEALRIFHPTYTPPQLGLNIGEELPSMKAKFGEPAFILEEPRNRSKAPPAIAKNYVYPISQVSFQLSRPNAATAPQVISLMVFRFL